jgi:hypothetical protein
MSELRGIEEITMAHDRLIAILLKEVPSPFPEQEETLRGACDVLCWILGHEHNTSFDKNLRAIDEFHRQLGYVLKDGFVEKEGA